MIINSQTFFKFDPSRVPSPCFVVDEVAVEENLKILNRVQMESGAKVLLALKAFSMFSLAPLISKYLTGTCSSGLHEARLAHDEFSGGKDGQELHVFSAAYSAQDFLEICDIANHVVFNSITQWLRFQPLVKQALLKRPALDFALRINPEHSEGAADIYNPCAAGSRLGIVASTLNEFAALTNGELEGISGLHFHTLCEQIGRAHV